MHHHVFEEVPAIAALHHDVSAGPESMLQHYNIW